MKTRIVRIGNSRGIRIPKPLLEQAGLDDEVELEVAADGLRITAAATPRAGWEAAAALLAERREDELLIPGTPTAFDTDEWEW